MKGLRPRFRGDPSQRARSLAILGIRGIPARYGGFETFAEELSTRLVELGFEVTVFCEGVQGDRPSSYRGVRLEYVPAPDLRGLTTVLHDLRCIWRGRKRFGTLYILGYSAAQFCWLPRLWGTRVWMNMDGLEWARAKYGVFARAYLKLMEALCMWTPSRLIADAEAIRDVLARRHSRLPPCDVIPYGAYVLDAPPDPAPLSGWGLPPGGYHLVVCRFEPENHVLEILEGFAASKSAHVLAVLGRARGRTPYAARLEAVAARDPRIRLLGTVYEPEQLRALRYHALSYLHGHSVGGTNPSLLEALGCHNAVVAHDNVFNREVAGEAALYFRTPADVAGCVEQIEGDPALRARLSEYAAERVRARYTWERVTEAYLGLLGTAEIGPRRAPAASGRRAR